MIILHHMALCPYCRKIRIILHEKGLSFSLEEEDYKSLRQEKFRRLNPAGLVPVIIDEEGQIISDSMVIAEFIDERYKPASLFGKDIYLRAEVRRISCWFDGIFGPSCAYKIFSEKVGKIMNKAGPPDLEVLRRCKKLLKEHLDYMGILLGKREYLASDELSAADFTAASHLSSLDYLGEIPWSGYKAVSEWYIKLKSRPSFRSLLEDRIPGIPPVAHYSEVDF